MYRIVFFCLSAVIENIFLSNSEKYNLRELMQANDAGEFEIFLFKKNLIF